VSLQLLATFDIHMSVHRNIIPNYSQQDVISLDLSILTDGVPSFPRQQLAAVLGDNI